MHMQMVYACSYTLIWYHVLLFSSSRFHTGKSSIQDQSLLWIKPSRFTFVLWYFCCHSPTFMQVFITDYFYICLNYFFIFNAFILQLQKWFWHFCNCEFIHLLGKSFCFFPSCSLAYNVNIFHCGRSSMESTDLSEVVLMEYDTKCL